MPITRNAVLIIQRLYCNIIQLLIRIIKNSEQILLKKTGHRPQKIRHYRDEKSPIKTGDLLTAII